MNGRSSKRHERKKTHTHASTHMHTKTIPNQFEKESCESVRFLPSSFFPFTNNKFGRYNTIYAYVHVNVCTRIWSRFQIIFIMYIYKCEYLINPRSAVQQLYNIWIINNIIRLDFFFFAFNFWVCTVHPYTIVWSNSFITLYRIYIKFAGYCRPGINFVIIAGFFLSCCFFWYCCCATVSRFEITSLKYKIWWVAVCNDRLPCTMKIKYISVRPCAILSLFWWSVQTFTFGYIY